MPRTKVARKVQAKRQRRSSTEEKLEAKLREFDMLADQYFTNLDDEYNDVITKLTEMMHTIRTKTPNNILLFKMSELREADARTYSDVNKTQTNVNGTGGSTLASLSIIVEEMRKSKKPPQCDEGYLTEDGTHSNRSSNNDVGSTFKNNVSNSGRPLGPLASAIAKPRRRSRSAGPPVTGTPMIHNSVKTSINPKARATPLMKTQSSHTSRSKYRTPMQTRPQAVSADRGIGLITPKVQPNMPLALLRRAKIGETVYSVTGSPVITSAAVEEVANVNIPIANGILSIRPQEMGSVDASMIKKIDSVTIEHLKQLQMNLNMIMQVAERANFNMRK